MGDKKVIGAWMVCFRLRKHELTDKEKYHERQIQTEKTQTVENEPQVRDGACPLGVWRGRHRQEPSWSSVGGSRGSGAAVEMIRRGLLKWNGTSWDFPMTFGKGSARCFRLMAPADKPPFCRQNQGNKRCPTETVRPECRNER